VAACAGARRLDIVGDGTRQYASQGACYDPTTQITVCFRPGATSSNPSLTQTECEAASNVWYAKGAIGADGCCLCDSNCDHSLETAAAGTCNYPDRNAGSCQNAATGQVTCDVTAGQCASPNVWSEAGALDSDGCCFCDETCDHSAETGTDCHLKDYADESQSDGSCYIFTTQQIMCDVGHATCDAMGAYWYSPGFISGSSGCCHCDASCDHDLETPHVLEKYPGWNCNASIPNDCDPIDLEVVGCSVVYYGADGTQGSGGGHGAEYGPADGGACYNADGTHGITCNVAEADCTGDYLAPGYTYGGCCLCEAGCDHSAETSTDCSYYDDEGDADDPNPWGWQTLAGYQTATDVGPHAKIDLDMEELEIKVGEYDINPNWITEAMFIYENGGGGLCSQADVDAAMTSDTTPWCTDTTQALGNSQKSTSIRTLKGFATKNYASDKLTGADGGNYGERMPPIYAGYWNDWAWADTFITKDYSATVKPSGWNQLIKKGANYQAVWMYVLHEFEDAVADCTTGDITANDEAVHAWDEGWAFYAGSLVAESLADAAKSSTASAEGTLLWELAEKRGGDFGTMHSSGPSNANVAAQAAAIAGRDALQDATCTAGTTSLATLTKQMTIPLIQGTIKYAWKADPAKSGSSCDATTAQTAGKTAMLASDDCVKSWAEGWAFAAALLPQLHQCNADVAAVVRQNLDIAAAEPMSCGFDTVKTAIESCYTSMGVTCTDIGAFQSSTGVYAGADACTAIPATPTAKLATCLPAASDDATAPALALGAAAAAAGAALLL